MTRVRPSARFLLRVACALLAFSAAFTLFTTKAHAADLFPFVLPWDDAAPSITDLSAWNEAPAGRDGFVVVKDGHLFAGKKRLRIFGVNVAFGANFPREEDAEKVAARMAKFGINCVRFHHMDMMSAPGGIFAADGRTLDPGQLDKLDYFIAQLAAHGIYADLNLHVSRTYPDRPKAEKESNPSFDKGVDNFDPAMIAMQKDYARALLTHVNAYTHHAYVDEPTVALVEINNENALLDEWQNGGLDRAAAPYREELTELWTKWLKEDYTDEDKWRASWADGARKQGPEMLRNGDFAHGIDPWFVEQHESATVEKEVLDGALRLNVGKVGTAAWHVQAMQGALQLHSGESYTFSFRARASVNRTVAATASQAHGPWNVFGSKSFDLTPEWRDCTFTFVAGSDDDNARVGFSGLGLDTGWVEFAQASLHIAGVDGSVRRDAEGRIPAFTRDEFARRTVGAREDWTRFLWGLEEGYWPGMMTFLREELHCHSLIVGTQLGWSPFPIQSHMDVIDSHAYWQHPNFPHRQWDLNDWTVNNIPMAGAANGGTLPGLALQRVAGKPYICTEYNHSAPNQFASETFPLVCAYAALQDWDGIFAFAYSHRTDDWDKRAIAGFFDIDQHPTKMATLPASLALFLRPWQKPIGSLLFDVRGDVAPAKTENITGIELNHAINFVRDHGRRIGGESLGLKWHEAFEHRVGVRISDGEDFLALPKNKSERYTSDTGELVWDAQKKVVTINTRCSKGVIGQGGTFTLGDVTITVASEWATVQATVMENSDFAHAHHILITATGAAENTGMKWRDAAKTSVGNDFGGAPSLVEGIAATVKLPTAGKLHAWALDERGQHRNEIPIADGQLQLSPEHKTLWYEVVAE